MRTLSMGLGPNRLSFSLQPAAPDQTLAAAAATMPPPLPPPPPPPLMEEIIEEILVRFPPQEPASLLRAALVSKQWCRLISGPGFRRRFRVLHQTPPLLGFLVNDVNARSRFVPTTAFCSPHGDRGDRALDARHGRVLLREHKEVGEHALVVWDPITDERKDLPVPSAQTVGWLPQRTVSWAAAILCSAAGGTCDHLDCHRGPFLVVLVASDRYTTFVYTYSSDVDAWSQIVFSFSRNHPDPFNVDPECIGRVGNDLYFGDLMTNIILKYNLGSREMSWIQIPCERSALPSYVLTTVEESRLGLVTVIGSKLYEWLRKDSHEGWVQTRVIELKTLLPFGAIITLPCVVGFADGLGIVFLKSSNLLYTIDLKTYNVKKLCPQGSGTSIVPYMSFYTPALESACSDEEPSAGGSSAR